MNKTGLTILLWSVAAFHQNHYERQQLSLHANHNNAYSTCIDVQEIAILFLLIVINLSTNILWNVPVDR